MYYYSKEFTRIRDRINRYSNKGSNSGLINTFVYLKLQNKTQINMSGTDSETSYPPELLRVEVKNKYLELVRNLSFLELKQFNKMTYAEIVYEDMSKLLPNFDQTRLKETYHYVSNSLNTEAQRQLKRKSRGSSNANEKETDQVLSSFLKDLDTTINGDQSGDEETENTDDNDSADELNDDNPQTQVRN